MGRGVVIQTPIFSDALHQRYMCAAMSLEDEWVDDAPSTVPEETAAALSVEEFRERYESVNLPVVIRGAANAWPAMTTWTRERLGRDFGETDFVVGGYDVALRDFFAMSDACRDDTPLYLFDPSFGEKAPALAREYNVPEYFAEDDYFKHMGEGRPHYRWLIVGPSRSGSIFHKDPNATSAWNAVVSGRKKWVMFPPDVIPPGVHPSEDGAEVAQPLSMVEWFASFYDFARDADAASRPLECVCEPGDVLFVPSGWWHMALNVTECIAVTQNFVSRTTRARYSPFSTPSVKISSPGRHATDAAVWRTHSLPPRARPATHVSPPPSTRTRRKRQEKRCRGTTTTPSQTPRAPTFHSALTSLGALESRTSRFLGTYPVSARYHYTRYGTEAVPGVRRTSRPALDVTKSAARPRYLHHPLARVRHVHRRARGRDERCTNGARARSTRRGREWGAAVTRKPPRRTATSSSYLSVRVVPRATAADASETTAKKSAPRWDLPRPPHDAGAAPENGTWSPTNQTIKDWRSLYKNTTLSVKGDGEGRVIEGAAIEGEIPKELKGTLFRNGPGLLEIYGKKLNQFFDGDGSVYPTTFDGEGGV